MKSIEESPAQEAKSRIGVVPWNPWLALVFIICVYFLSQLAGGLLLSIYPLLKHWSNAQANSWGTNSVVAQFIYVFLAEAFTIGAIYLFLRHYKTNFKIIGLKRPRWRDPIYGIAAWVLYFIPYVIAVAVISHFVPSLNVNQQQQIGFTNVHGAAQLIMTCISLVILPPITEEIMVRGFLYGSLKKGMPKLAAVIVTSVIFASAHLPEGGAAGPLYIAAIDTFILSLVLIFLREKTQSLWPSITLHAFKNGIAFVTLFLVSSR
jgi:membrane protease YdiL (CAAX protease family)